MSARLFSDTHIAKLVRAMNFKWWQGYDYPRGFSP